MRQAQKLLRLGERYTPSRLQAACQRALAVDLVDVRRLERILVQALEAEATAPAAASSPPAPAARFARPGSAFAQGAVPRLAPGQALATHPDQERARP